MDEELKKQQEFYDRGWGSELEAGKEQRGNLRTNLDFLSQTNLLKPNDKILEIGCGIGSIVSELSKRRYDITGTDISSKAIEYGLKKYGDIKLQVQPAEELQFEDQTFDVVLSFDLFEHIAKVDRHISEVHRLLKADGLYLLQTPNKYSNVIFETMYHKSLKWRRAHSLPAYARPIETKILEARIPNTIRQNESGQRIHLEQAQEKTWPYKRHLQTYKLLPSASRAANKFICYR